MVLNLLLGIFAGFSGHLMRPAINKLTPSRRGLLPIACYLVGSLIVVFVDAFSNGWRHAAKTFVSFATVGSGVVLGWIFDAVIE